MLGAIILRFVVGEYRLPWSRYEPRVREPFALEEGELRNEVTGGRRSDYASGETMPRSAVDAPQSSVVK